MASSLCCLSPPCSATSISVRSAWKARSKPWAAVRSTSIGRISIIVSGLSSNSPKTVAPAFRPGWRRHPRNSGGAGKTTLLIKVIPALIARGLRVSTLKHAHHAFDVDQPGKDSHSHRMAGATEVLVGAASRWALVHELRGEAEPQLDTLLGKLSPV